MATFFPMSLQALWTQYSRDNPAIQNLSDEDKRVVMAAFYGGTNAMLLQFISMLSSGVTQAAVVQHFNQWMAQYEELAVRNVEQFKEESFGRFKDTPVEVAWRLRRAYDKAAADGKTEFEFDGHTVVVNYAYYLLEYLSKLRKIPKLKPTKRPDA